MTIFLCILALLAAMGDVKIKGSDEFYVVLAYALHVALVFGLACLALVSYQS